MNAKMGALDGDRICDDQVIRFVLDKARHVRGVYDMRCAIVVTGLPASGKTTVARDIASALGFEFLDKDDFLERLYESHGVSSWDDRKRLSRLSDDLLQQRAKLTQSVVLVSHWRPRTGTDESGTPTDWLTAEFEQIVEVYCECSAEIATLRFLERRRHTGHMDQQRDRVTLTESMKTLHRSYPLGLGALVKICSEHKIDLAELISRIRQEIT